MASSATRANSGSSVGRASRGGLRGWAWRAGLLLGCAGCSQSDSFIGAQIDYQLRQGETPALDLALVGPARWSRVCVLGPGTDEARAAALLGFAWPVTALTSIGRRDDAVVLVFTDGARALAFVERSRADGDFAGVQPPCLSRAEAQLATRREAGGGLRVVRPGGP